MRKILFCIVFLFVVSVPIYAHPGNKDKDGCHCCYTDECYGEYHCHENDREYIPENPKACLGPNQKTPDVTPNIVLSSETKEEKKDNNDFSLLEALIPFFLITIPIYKLYVLIKEKKINDEIKYFTKCNIHKLQGKRNPYTKKYMNTFYQCRMYIEEYYNRHDRFPDI